jgi:CHAD domain-containing protein
VTSPRVTLPIIAAVDVAISPWVEALRSMLGLDTPTDPLAIHRARTATRRLRSNLRALGDVIDAPEALRADLAWVGDSLGMVRDADVLGDRLAEMLADAPGAVGSGGDLLLATVAEGWRSAHERLRGDVSSVRFGNLVHDLDVLAKEASAATGTIDAATVMHPRWRALRHAVRSLDTPASDTQLHEVRIETKRARYAAEIFQEAGGAASRRFIRRATEVQDILGQQHDAARACGWLLAQDFEDRAAARATGWLAAITAAERESLRDAWRPSWRSLGRRKARFW